MRLLSYPRLNSMKSNPPPAVIASSARSARHPESACLMNKQVGTRYRFIPNIQFLKIKHSIRIFSQPSTNNPQLSVAVEEAADGVTQTFPIDWLGEMGGETGGFGGDDVAGGSESAKRDSVYLTGMTQLVHQIQAAAIG